jgi:hypothetical protein
MKKVVRRADVDKSRGVIFPRPKLVVNDRTKIIYDRPAKGDQPDDITRFSSIDAAYKYLTAGQRDKQLTHRDQLKAVFAAGLFIGMLIMAGLMAGLHRYLE